ncbi:MAG: ABC transporter ATP-binding protein [Candidatus Thermoplasmatota archaeon]
MGILETKNLSLEIKGKKILHDINIDIWRGHVHAIVGPNGAGKSTLASAIMGLTDYRQHSGKILFEGEEIQDLDIDERASKGITFGWQEPARYEGLKVRDFLSAGSKNKDKEYISEKLELMGLNPDEYLSRAVDETLSGGERKKIELASILALDPDLIMLDEPDSGIDVGTLDKIFEVIKKLKEKGTTIVLITHSVAVLRQAEHAFLMCHGEIIEKGKAGKIIPYFEEKCIPCPHKNVPDEGGIKS